MQQLTNVQSNLKKIVENYRAYHKDYNKYKKVYIEYNLVDSDRKDWQSFIQNLREEFVPKDFSKMLKDLEDSIYKICRCYEKSKHDRNLFSVGLDKEFINSLGLDFSVDFNVRNTGKFYTFYIDNKKVFSKFDILPKYDYSFSSQ